MYACICECMYVCNIPIEGLFQSKLDNPWMFALSTIDTLLMLWSMIKGTLDNKGDISVAMYINKIPKAVQLLDSLAPHPSVSLVVLVSAASIQDYLAH